MAQHASAQPSAARKASWLDRAVDIFKRQPGSPPKPKAPALDQSAWEKSVEQPMSYRA
jgi:hypothetical protein